ncbi:MAG TPA: YciI family protein [Thermoanaerobaculia bacterium]|nr:YciI family protein [Thermoanaerobaculia bacterium]
MRYLLLIYDAESQWAGLNESQKGQMFQEYMTFTESIKKSGHWLAGQQLQPIASATTVRIRNGRMTTTDGPFAETREQLGGFYMIEASNLDEATAIAARVPSAKIGSIEVRPIVERAG